LRGSTSNWNKSQGRERRSKSSPRPTNFALNKNDIDQSFLKKEGWSKEICTSKKQSEEWILLSGVG